MENKNSDKRFGGVDLKEEYASFDKSKAVILSCPFEGTVTYGQGCSKGPNAILDASNNMELFDEELKIETYKMGIHTKSPLSLENISADDMVEKIKKEVSSVLEKKKIPVLLGGEHSISIGAVLAACKIYNDLSVLHLDAHYDLRNKYENSPYNHACVARRFLESCSVVEAGVRSLCKEEQDFLDTAPSGLKIMDIYGILSKKLWKEEIIKSLKKNVYVSLDLDVFDPSFMPSVGTPEPGGIGWYELLDLFKKLSGKRKIIGFDVVELTPINNLSAPDFLVAKLIYKLLGYIWRDKKCY